MSFIAPREGLWRALRLLRRLRLGDAWAGELMQKDVIGNTISGVWLYLED
jgi:hypothetical protein